MRPLAIVPYDPRWPAQFARERARLAAALGAVALRIEHNGSTAVPGMAAKPVIDIQVSVAAVQPMTYLPLLERLGYVHVPHADDAFCPYLHRPAAWPHSHHVHVVEAGGVEEARTLAFRDYLREHPAVVAAYARLKHDLAPHFSASDPAARQAYADAKGEFIERIIAAALAEGYPRARG
jgi:GrpB-like predicted nucleotidyltransferase (UPF0157 family)